MQIVRAVTSCNLDTTTSSTPQYLADVKPVPKIQCDAADDASDDDGNRMTLDDCDDDIPSPEYSLLEGNRELCPSVVINELQNDDDAIIPIDLTWNERTHYDDNIDGSQISANVTISSSQSVYSTTGKMSVW